VFSPSSRWLRHHFDTGKEKPRQLAFRYSGHPGKYLLGCRCASNKEGVRTGIREGVRHRVRGRGSADRKISIEKVGRSDGNAGFAVRRAVKQFESMIDRR
jgi:hypothetical protein